METIEKTDRGYNYIQFVDANDVPCSIQESSSIGPTEGAINAPGSSMLWVGIEDSDPKCLASQAAKLGVEQTAPNGWQPYPLPKDVMMNDRMHLTREQVMSLIFHLQRWVDKGTLGNDIARAE